MGFQKRMSNHRSKHILVTGGTRSGKSQFAEKLAISFDTKVVYVATAFAPDGFNDQEMSERIAKHRQRRPSEWLTIEKPLNIDEVLLTYQAGYTLIIDCLTIYVSNLLFQNENFSTEAEAETIIHNELVKLAEAIKSSTANVIIVSNEVGWGIVPENKLARIFRDLAGSTNQIIAKACHEVYLVVSGIPVKIKGEADVAQI